MCFEIDKRMFNTPRMPDTLTSSPTPPASTIQNYLQAPPQVYYPSATQIPSDPAVIRPTLYTPTRLQRNILRKVPIPRRLLQPWRSLTRGTGQLRKILGLQMPWSRRVKPVRRRRPPVPPLPQQTFPTLQGASQSWRSRHHHRLEGVTRPPIS